MKYKLFITDYDGTLGHGKDIDLETVNAIKEYQKKGGKFVICTGRSFESILPICKSYGLIGDIISFQGALISNIETGKVIYDGYVDKNDILELKDKLVKDGLAVGIYIGDYLRYDRVDVYLKVYLSAVNAPAFLVDDLSEAVLNAKENVRKIIAIGSEKDISLLQKKYEKEFEGRLIVNTSSPMLFEAVSPLNSKGESVKRIAKYYNIPLSEVITVGDSLNDIELIKGEWHGVAVGDAVKELKDVAKEITLPFKDKPIKKLLENI